MHSLRTGSPGLVRTDQQTLNNRNPKKTGVLILDTLFFSSDTGTPQPNRNRRKDVKMILVNNHWCRIQKLYGASPDGFRERLQPDTAPVFIVRVLLNEQRFACKCAEHRFPNRAEGWRRKRTCSTSFLGVITLSAFNG